jgi:hypothetical protein
MSFVKNLYADLVEKRLWPVAAGLLIALVAVPVLLAKPASESSPQAPADTALLSKEAAALVEETKPVVTLGADGPFRKHVDRLPRKNPFVQQARQPSGSASEAATVATGTTGSSGSTGVPGTTTPTSGTGGDTGGGSQSQKLYRYVAEVKFGRIGKTKKETVSPAEFMPSEQNPVILFLGADDSGDNALFLVSPEVTARGDGVCVPSDSNCQIVRMKKDDVEFFEVSLSAETVVTYELELTDISLKEVKDAPGKTQGTSGGLGQLNAAKLRQMRRAMRSKRLFEALHELGH